MKKFLKKHLEKIVYYGIYLSFIIPIIYLLVMTILGDDISINDSGYHSRADYILMIVQCSLGLVAMKIPSFLEKKLKFEFPTIIYGMYIVFLYCAIFLGEVISFYYLFERWDNVLHCFSSLMEGFLGFMLISILNRNEKYIFKLDKGFMCLFAFCFAISTGALWEIYEYVFDGLLGLNMQKFMLSDGTVLVGHLALKDTMEDIMIDAFGAFVSSFVGYLLMKKDKAWFTVELKEE